MTSRSILDIVSRQAGHVSRSSCAPGAGSHHVGGGGQSRTIGHYDLIRTLGRGNFSIVKLARHRLTHHSVAIKIIRLSNLTEDNLIKVDREIEIMKKLGHHESIVKLYQVIKTSRYYFLITDCCTGGELYAYILDHGKFSERESCRYFLQILSAVEFLHDHNIVHRDLKSENLLFTDNYERIKLVDFGFANYFKPDDLLSTWCGSPPYAAPELFEGKEYVGPQVDIWSLACVLYVLVCGAMPFDGPTLMYLKGRVLMGQYRVPFFMTYDCENLLKRMLRRNPARRLTIKQIREHRWTKRFMSTESHQTNSVGCNSSVNRHCNFYPIPSPVSNKGGTLDQDKNATTNRGKSLDLEEDNESAHMNQKVDAPILSLTNCVNVDSNDPHRVMSSSKINPASTRRFVDNEIVNAVSNMSIDSNNSSMLQCNDARNSLICHQSSHVISPTCCLPHRDDQVATSSCRPPSRQQSQECSIDDHIIDYMVENLRIADHQDQVRQAIADEKYDDLHAIYSLLKDEPDMFLEARFKMPSLPLTSHSGEDICKRPSITTGFFNGNEIGINPRTSRDGAETFNSTDDGSIDLVRKKNSEGAAVIPVMNNLALQDAQVIQNLYLLDPAGLSTGFERRASDGQASYGSYTNSGTERSAMNQCDTRRNELVISQFGQARKRMRSEEVASWRIGEQTFRQEDQ